ncbi:potassium/sodium hyperpolarization-activated cyclic nucleotide-gated channel 2 [Tribolium castaneum]|uniref:potassium/sodium hyperpolarization-activated cyclic nucleotide-gated channel 2 n=1 Tax=Tribolium castaneum TaxID=7070 RepID=UPI0000D5668B|nr:PREDICTED: potassium/sodium hyperpolarization-activated cyclic nucleotide-gated channel 2 [Tribolium castaneum]|eukprot:XP_970324.1 PREDICTED: potassium/sodium hyperpolarization-activated cyclic nucleotide-gated channel 2 [Tribolium castaneum]
MPIEPKNRLKHDCDLRKEYQSSYHVSSPFDPWWKKCLNSFRLQLSVCKNKQSKRYFRSMSSLSNERKRHFSTPRYKNIIHPFSSFNRVKEMTLSVLLYVLFFFESFLGSFLGEEFHMKTRRMYVAKVLFVVNVILFLDIILRFFVGISNEKTREVILEKRVIAKFYLRSYFIFDLLPIIGFVVFYFTPIKNLNAKIAIYELHKLRLVRMRTVVDNAFTILKKFKLKDSTQTVVVITISVLLTLHEWSCILSLIYTIRRLHHMSNRGSFVYQYYQRTIRLSQTTVTHNMAERTNFSFRVYLLYMSIISCHFFGCDTSIYETKRSAEMVVLSLVLINGMMYYIGMVAKVLQMFGVANISENRYEELNWQVNQYMTKKKFPGALKRRIFQYYDYKYGNKFFSEQEILDSLTERLRMEVLLYSCRNLITEVKIFKGLSKSAVGCILALLKQEIYLPGEMIMSAEESSDSIYFILYGTCMIQVIGGKELWHIEDGTEFGDAEKFSEEEKIGFLYQIVALEATEVYELQVTDLAYCCTTYPEITFKMEAMARNKARVYNQTFARRTQENDYLGEILDELNKGNILHHGIKREDFN